MSQWKKVRIGDFLTERAGRYKPDDPTIAQYQRLDKIDFSGTIHISTKPTKTDMILVQPGDLVISGINVAKGAVSVYQGTEPVCATIHYSAYTFNEKIVDLDFFKFFVKSPAFLYALKRQVKGGIKTEIKPKHLLPLEISIPDLSEQKRIVVTVSNSLKKTEDLQKEIDSQNEYVKLLRQNILQDAIEGKLTSDWRKSNPVIKGNPDYDAEALFEKIQKEKSSYKKQKELSSIIDEETPFEIPEGWKWINLGMICKKLTDGSHNPPPNTGKGYPVISAMNIKNGHISFDNVIRYTDEQGFQKEDKRTKISRGDIILGIIGASIGNTAIYDSSKKVIAQRSIAIIDSFIGNTFVSFLLNSTYVQKYLKQNSFGSAQGGIYLGKISKIPIPLPLLKEQEEIVNTVESLLANVTELETQIQERETYTKCLMQSILKDAFEEK